MSEAITKAAEALADTLDNEFVSGRISNHAGRNAAQMLRQLCAALSQAGQGGQRDREQDRARYPDQDFNRWLDETITENGEFTAWHALSNTGDAYAGWSVRPSYAGRQGGQGEVLPIELLGVQEAIKEGDGFWVPCSGCHELNEGHSTGPASKVFGCALGNGCSECGGIGAVWDNTDYDDMARHFMQAGAEAAQPAPVPETVGSGAMGDTGPEVLRQVFALCEATEDAEVSASSVDSQAAQDFMRGRKFEAKQIRRAIGTWFQDEYCGRSFMGEPAAQQTAPVPATVASGDAEIARLTTCLNIANNNHEHFEFLYHLKCDELEAAQQPAPVASAAAPLVNGIHPLESTLTPHEAAFVRRVFACPGCKLNDEGESSHWEGDGSEFGKHVDHWRRPEDLGLIRCVGSYKWEPTALLTIGIAQQTAPAVPAGWQLVPVEPTPEIRNAYHAVDDDAVIKMGAAGARWAAMLSAAPKPEHGEGK